jgi:diguanylate cyclase
MAKYVEEGVEMIYQTAKKVLLLMAREQISMTPENYRLLYDFTLGRNDPLRIELNSLFSKKTVFTPELSKALYEKYYVKDEGKEVVSRVSDEIHKILKEVVKDITATSGNMHNYNSSLKKYVNALDDVNNVIELKEIVQDLLLETHQMEQSTGELKKQLDTVTWESEKLQEELKEVKQEAILDALTGLYNRKYLKEKLGAYHLNFQQDGSIFSVVMLDIDHFKNINDSYGHNIGDAVLEFTGLIIKDAVKGKDIPARYGGEEFVILLPMTLCRNACMFAENLRKDIAEKPLKIKKTQKNIGNISVSIGVAQIRKGDTPDSLIERADRALYLAKQSGRNNVQSENNLKDEIKDEAEKT